MLASFLEPQSYRGSKFRHKQTNRTFYICAKLKNSLCSLNNEYVLLLPEQLSQGCRGRKVLEEVYLEDEFYFKGYVPGALLKTWMLLK